MGQGIEATSEFKGPHALKIFALEINLRTQLRVQRDRLQDGCEVCVPVQTLRGGQDIFKSGQGQHGFKRLCLHHGPDLRNSHR